MPGKSRTFAVIGLGTFGSTVASMLAKFGNRVLGIDIDSVRVGRMASVLSEAVIADGRDIQALKEAGVENCDVAVIAIGENLEGNILATMNAKVLGVSKVWVKALSQTHHEILNRIGVDRVIEPEFEIGQHAAQTLHNPLIHDYVNLENGFHVVNISAPQSLNAKTIYFLQNLTQKFSVRCLGLMRGAEFISCVGLDTEIKEGDMLLLLGHPEDLRHFGSQL